MTTGSALLAFACCLLAGAQANPIGLEYTYKCCRESLLADSNQFKQAKGVDTLEACKTFCETNDYGSPIYGVGGWQCTTSKNFLCREVERSHCPDDITQSQGYYRYYPTSSLVRITDTTIRTRINTNNSDININDISRGDSRRVILGGRTSGVFSSEELGNIRIQQFGAINTTRGTDVVRTARFEGDVNINDLGGVVTSSGTGTIRIDLLRRRSGGNTTTAENTKRTDRQISETIQDLSRNGNSDLFKRENIIVDTLARRGTTVEQRSGESNSTRVAVAGGSQLSAHTFFGGATPVADGFRGNNTNITATRSRAVGSILTDSAGTVVAGVSGSDSSFRLVQGADGRGLLRRTAITSSTTDTRQFTSAGGRDLDSERKILEKDDFGVIDQTTNSSRGSVNSIANLEGTTDELRLVNTTRECPNCISQNNDQTRRRSILTGRERASSRSQETDVNTVTRADGRELVIRGTTGTETNSTLLDTNTDGVSRQVITSQAEADCDRSKGTCAQKLNRSRVRLVDAANSSSTEDVVETKKSSIFIGNY